MGNQKVIIDTNVIVAASIIENIKELNIQVTHKFYSQSIHLFSIFRKRYNENIGIITPTAKSESFRVLSKAVKTTFIPDNFQDINTKRIFFEKTVGFVNSSEHRMRKLLSLLVHKKLNVNEIKKYHNQVKTMSFYLKDLWYRKYAQKLKREKESKNRAENIKTEKYWKDHQKEEVLDTHRGQVAIEAKQLEKFMKKWPNRNDEMILAETIAIKKDYENSGEIFKFYIASCDTGFFSPMIYQDIRSDIVTKEIAEKFDITCDLPKVIHWIVDPQLED